MKKAMALLAPLTLLASAVEAQPEVGSLIDRNRGSVGSVRSETTAAARQVMNTYGRCVARNRTQRVEPILAMPLLSDEQVGVLRVFLEQYDSCLGNDIDSIRFDHLILLGAMSEWFILNRYADVGISRVAQVSDVQGGQSATLSRSMYESIATCVARSDPAAAFALVQTMPASDDERAAMNRIVPLLAPCLPRGENSFSRSSLRATVAAGLYRLLAVASSPSPERAMTNILLSLLLSFKRRARRRPSRRRRCGPTMAAGGKSRPAMRYSMRMPARLRETRGPPSSGSGSASPAAAPAPRRRCSIAISPPGNINRAFVFWPQQRGLLPPAWSDAAHNCFSRGHRRISHRATGRGAQCPARPRRVRARAAQLFVHRRRRRLCRPIGAR